MDTSSRTPALVAAAAGALHLVDANVVEPGLARAGDHVWGTVGPLLWLAVLAGLTGAGPPADGRQPPDAPKEIWQTPGAHTGGLFEAPAEYERRVIGFLDRALLG